MSAATALETRAVKKRQDFVDVSALLSQEQSGALLSGQEHRALRYLSDHAGRFVPADELGDFVVGPIRSVSHVRTVVLNLRKKLGPAFIETGPDGGYRVSQSRADALERECPRCRRVIVEYGAEWVCFACGATGKGPQPLESVVELEVGRAAYREGSRSGRPWSEEEKAFVLAHVAVMTLEAMGAALDRSESAVRGFLAPLEIRKPYVREGATCECDDYICIEYRERCS